ncbi:unnamed protein product, partial [Darwinula stevensoni]
MRYYKMDHPLRGKALIFNQEKFLIGLPERTGTEFDRNRLARILKQLKFEVIVYENHRHQRIRSLIEKVALEDHDQCDCILVCFMSHGDEYGNLFGSDGAIRFDELWTPFMDDCCPSLAGKPKIFIIQVEYWLSLCLFLKFMISCRGSKVNDGNNVMETRNYSQPDSTKELGAHYNSSIPPDFLFVFSTTHGTNDIRQMLDFVFIEGYCSWRNPTEGSHFLQCLCDVLQQGSQDEDLLSLLEEVSKKIEKESYYCHESDGQLMKQMPDIKYNLTKKLKLHIH